MIQSRWFSLLGLYVKLLVFDRFSVISSSGLELLTALSIVDKCAVNHLKKIVGSFTLLAFKILFVV